MSSMLWTSEAMVNGPRGTIATFQRNSYAARVKYADGTAVVVALPPGAAHYPTAAWEPIVRRLADYTRRTTPARLERILEAIPTIAVEMTSPPYTPPPPA